MVQSRPLSVTIPGSSARACSWVDADMIDVVLHLDTECTEGQQTPEPSFQLLCGDELGVDLKGDRLGILAHGNRQSLEMLGWNLVRAMYILV